MIDLPTIFKNDIQGNTTYLTPLIIINDRIYLSTKKIKFDDNIYMPFLKSIGNISESVDINSRKFKISDSTITFYNYRYDNKNLMDKLLDGEIFNSKIQVFYKSQNAKSLNDCLRVYSGYVKDITENNDTLRISSEDQTEITLGKEIPKKRTSASEDLPQKHRSQYIPIVYGILGKAPVVYDLLEDDNANLKITSDTYYIRGVDNLKMFDNDAYADVREEARLFDGQVDGTIFKKITNKQWETKGDYIVIEKHTYSDNIEDENTILTSEGREGSPLAFDMAEIRQYTYLNHTSSSHQQYVRLDGGDDETAIVSLTSYKDMDISSGVPVGSNPSFNTKSGIYIAMPQSSVLDNALATEGGVIPIKQNRESFGEEGEFENLFGIVNFNFETQENFVGASDIVTTLLEDNLEDEKDFLGICTPKNGTQSCYGASSVLDGFSGNPMFAQLYWQLEATDRLAFHISYSANEDYETEVDTYYNINRYHPNSQPYLPVNTKNVAQNSFQMGLRVYDDGNWVLPDSLHGGYYLYFYFQNLAVERVAVVKDFSKKKLFATVVGRMDNSDLRYTTNLSTQTPYQGTQLNNSMQRTLTPATTTQQQARKKKSPVKKVTAPSKNIKKTNKRGY